MEPVLIIPILNGVIIIPILISGGLEWYAAALLGVFAPFIGLILAMPITLLVGFALLKSAKEGDEFGGLFAISIATSQLLVLVGAILLANSMRKTKP